MPPSADITSPVTKRAASEARNTTTTTGSAGRVVHQHVDPAQCVEPRRCQLDGRVRELEVGRRHDRIVLAAGRDRVERVAVAAGERHAGTGTVECDRDRRADPSRGTGHECAPVVEGERVHAPDRTARGRQLRMSFLRNHHQPIDAKSST
jgi:hypothetical protein